MSLCVSILAFLILSFTPTTAHAGVSWGIDIGVADHRGRGSFRDYDPWRDYYAHRYYPPRYYTPVSYTYIVETAPVNAIVYAIPAGSRQYIVNGTAYFEYNGTYYVPVAGGYQVVPQPVIYQPAVVVAPPTVITPATAPASAQGAITVNVPNSQGGFTAVNLTRSGSGFIGPQGEFYNEFPKVEQLRVMYTK